MIGTLESTLQNLFFHQDQRPKALVIGAVVGAVGVLLGLSVVYLGWIITFGAVGALLVGLYLLTSLEGALYVLIATAILLPFGTLPFRIGFTPSLIETALGGFLVVYLMQWMSGRRRTLHLTPVSWSIVVLLLVLVLAFILGLRHAMFTMNTLKTFVSLCGIIGFSLILADVASHVLILRRISLVMLLVGAVAGTIGIVLWLLPDATAETILNRLGRFGYPVGGVIRYREDGVAIGQERAIGTWVDPNAYAGFLLMVGGLAGTQLFSPRPLTKYRWLAFACFGMIITALFLSDSRGSFLGLVFGLGVVAVLRYRNLLWVGIAGALMMPFLPPTRAFLDRIIAGFTASDLETQMRLGEYQDALTLIERYPVLGVGFTGVPDIDLYVAVSSTYLLLASYAGALGLLAFAMVFVTVIGWGLRWWAHIQRDDELADVWLGLLAGIMGVLLGGVVDHFYFNPQFQATSFMLWAFMGLFMATTRLVWEQESA